MIIFMPVFSMLYFIFILSNFGFPGTCNFVGESLILVGGFEFSNVIIFLSALGLVLTLFYSLFLYNRIFFGSLQTYFIRYYSDCSRLEFYVLSILAIFVIFGGLYPTIVFPFFLTALTLTI
jgi:NADH-ubiquinone oxidoreductase chain 4